ncbi:MAG: phage tail protein, partial [Mesorhizobium sp.]
MVKTPKVRHSKSRREPVIIELEPGAVSRITGEDAAKDEANPQQTDEAKAEEAADASQPDAPEEPIHAEQTDVEAWEHADTAQAAADGPEAKGKDEAEAPYPGGEEAAKSEPKSFGYNFEDASTRTGPAPSAPKPGEARSDDHAAPPSGRAGVRTLAAGVIGGVIALAGAGLLQAVGLLGSPASGGPSLDGVNGEIASLKG